MDIYFEDDLSKNVYLLSKSFIKKLENTGEFDIIRKIGEGGNNLVLLARSNTDNEYYTLLISKNIECTDEIEESEGIILIRKMQKEGLLDNSIVSIYESFIVKNTRLTDDANYCPGLRTKDILVHVEEYIDGITLDEKVFQISKENRDVKIIFFLQLRDRITELLEYIKSKGIYYSDLKALNFILRDRNDLGSLTFIDLDSFGDRERTMRSLEMTSEQFEREIKSNLGEYMYGKILAPLSVEESKITDYKELKNIRAAGLFTQEEIGLALGMIISGFVPKIIPPRRRRESKITK